MAARRQSAASQKLPQLATTNMIELVGLAKAAGCITDLAIAKWIIASSGYWRLLGYEEIRVAMKRVDS